MALHHHPHHNIIQGFMDELYHYITDQSPVKPCNLIKQNITQLFKNGDFSFSNKRNVWMSYLSSVGQEVPGFCSLTTCKHTEMLFLAEVSSADADADNKTDNDDDDDDDDNNVGPHTHYTVTKLLSKRFALHVATVRIVGDWCNVFLDRRKCFADILRCVSEQSDGVQEGHWKTIKVTRDNNVGLSVTDYRLQLLESVVKNLINESDYWVLETDSDERSAVHVHLTTRSNKSVASECKKIISGIVVDPQHGNKLATMTMQQYVKKRSTDMQLMAQHKYGLRVKNEAVFVALVEQLGLAAVTVDFMEVRYSSPVSLNVTGCSTSKGASFILYNSARIETILRKFNERVECGYYNALPDLSDIDISLLLSEEEEWQICIVYVAGYENLIERSLADIEHGRVAPHLICNFLCGLVGLFSIYYRRCRILVENRSQLMPQLYARIHLLKCIQKTLNNALALLNIEPVTQM